jgi:uncharacterized protein
VLPSTSVLLVLALAVTAGAMVQGTVGLGLGLLAAPVVTLVDASLMPGVMLWLASALPVLTLAREWRETDWRGLGWAFVGRVPATALGVWVVAAVSAQVLGLLVGVMVLVAVVLTARVVRLPVRPAVLAGAGVVSGVSGTATSIGGPPLALVYQHVAGPRLRATLGGYFLGGGLLSLVGLAAGGQLTARHGWTALVLAPCLPLGFVLAAAFRDRLDAHRNRTRTAVLVVCAASALVLIVRSAVTLLT